MAYGIWVARGSLTFNKNPQLFFLLVIVGPSGVFDYNLVCVYVVLLTCLSLLIDDLITRNVSNSIAHKWQHTQLHLISHLTMV